MGRCHEATGDRASAIAAYEQAAEGCVTGATAACRVTGRISGVPSTLAAHLSAWTRAGSSSDAAALKLQIALMQACDPAGVPSAHLPRRSLPRKVVSFMSCDFCHSLLPALRFEMSDFDHANYYSDSSWLG